MSRRNKKPYNPSNKQEGNKPRENKPANNNFSDPNKMADAIVRLFNKNPTQGMNYKEVSRALRIGNKLDRSRVGAILEKMVEEKVLDEISRGKYKLNLNSKKSNIKSEAKELEGIIDATSSGSAYLISQDSEQDIYIHPKNINKALHGDTVNIKVVHGRKKPEGIVTRIVQRARTEFIGTIQMNRNGKFGFLVPDNQRINIDLYIPLTKLRGAVDGEKAIGEITDWPSDSKNPFGRVTEVLGAATDNDVIMHSILFEYDLPNKFPEKVEQEAEKISFDLDQEEIKKRRDFRDVLTFTIDPHDAKDFDDALSIKKLSNGNYEIGVHIADVSHYMKPGGILDVEAYDRATSVYLVDRVVPMLPEKLSNGVCSLRPNEEKFTFSAVFELDEKANIVNEWFGRTVIYSDRRFSYEEAQEIIENKKGELSEEILVMDALAKKLRAKRFKSGAISFDRVEVKFNLDKADNATPTGVYFKESKDANKLIEEFMLQANRSVAKYIGDRKRHKNPKTFIYRIHDKPKPDRFEQFANFVTQFGYNIKSGDNSNIAKSLNDLLKDVHGKKEGNMIETLAVRTMAKAEYSTSNIGHYGLAFEYYSHFTSPIRRYPDVMVHRLLQQYLDGEKSASAEDYEDNCKHCSKMEKKAASAERDSIKYKQVEFMAKHLGEEFTAIISGVTEWGIYAEIEENLCEGMVSIRSMEDDTYILDADNYCLVGSRHGKKYQMGDRVNVQIKNADLAKKQLDYILVTD